MYVHTGNLSSVFPPRLSRRAHTLDIHQVDYNVAGHTPCVCDVPRMHCCMYWCGWICFYEPAVRNPPSTSLCCLLLYVSLLILYFEVHEKTSDNERYGHPWYHHRLESVFLFSIHRPFFILGFLPCLSPLSLCFLSPPRRPCPGTSIFLYFVLLRPCSSYLSFFNTYVSPLLMVLIGAFLISLPHSSSCILFPFRFFFIAFLFLFFVLDVCSLSSCSRTRYAGNSLAFFTH